MLYPFNGVAMENLNFDISSDNNKLNIKLVNNSSTDIIINKRFSLGREGKRGNIEFYFTDINGDIHKLTAKINYGRVTESDLMKLPPGKSFGKQFNINELLDYYDLAPGVYRVNAKYKNFNLEEMGAFIGEIESKPILLEIKK